MANTTLTRKLEAAETSGERPDPDELIALIYDDLRRVAAEKIGRERAGHMLQPTALVHEAYMKMVDHTRVAWRGRTHFFAVAAQSMRRILVDVAREEGAEKRGGKMQRIEMADHYALSPDRALDAMAIAEAFGKMRTLDEQMSRVAELRLFGGLSPEEIGEVLGVSVRTVHREWKIGQAWLRQHFTEHAS